MRPPTSEQMEAWLAESKTAEGRRRLLSDGAAATAASRALLRGYVAWHDDRRCDSARAQLLLTLRVLRNVCAAGAPAAAALMRCGLQCVVPAVAADIHLALASRPLSMTALGERQLLTACVQLLANFAVASEAAAATLWQECFPLIYEQLTATPDVSIQAAVTLSMLSAVKASADAASQVASPRAARIWLQLLHPLVSEECADEPSEAAAGAAAEPAAAEGKAKAPAGAAAANDCLGLLVKAVAVQHGLLEPLMRCLEAAPGAAAARLAVEQEEREAKEGAAAAVGPSGRRWNALHVALLHLVAHEVAGPAGGCGDGGCGGAEAKPAAAAAPAGLAAAAAAAAPEGSPWRWPRAALQLVCDAAADTAAAQRVGGGGGEAAARVAPHALEAALQVLRALVQREDGGAPLCGGADAVSLLMGPQAAGGAAGAEVKEESVEERKQQQQQQQQGQVGQSSAEGEDGAAASKAGAEDGTGGSGGGSGAGACGGGSVVDVTLALLAALGPPINPRRPDAAAHAAQRDQQLALLPPAARARALRAAPAAAPYPGYRADVLSVLSNALHGRAAAQRAAAAAGAAELLLSSTQLDEAAPLAREWALWGVRNLCAGAGGEEARARMAALQLQDAVVSPELERAGVKVEVDARGKLSVATQRAF